VIGTPLEKDWEAYRRHAAKSVRLVEEQLFPAVRARSEARTFNDLDDQIDEAVGQSVEALERLFVQFELRSDQARHQTTDGLRRVVGFGLALGLMNTIALLVGAFAIGRRVRATMEALQGGAKRLASGDLRISFPALQGRDEAIQVMGACQRMVDNGGHWFCQFGPRLTEFPRRRPLFQTAYKPWLRLQARSATVQAS